ncbi:hypothetical protein GCM10009737_17860 [Nocardioides lentus]|uniref:Rieske domain-containing protein n=1 Tax=Nocardioides lentus TaxID=338077 RepID=A0ABN2PAM2_9ACTN
MCRLEDLRVGQGAVALVHGQSVAVFRTSREEVHAVGNHDPFLHTQSVSRGIVGARDGVPFVGSARHGHAFDLVTGRCLDDEHAALPAYPVRIVDGRVLVGPRRVDLSA